MADDRQQRGTTPPDCPARPSVRRQGSGASDAGRARQARPAAGASQAHQVRPAANAPQARTGAVRPVQTSGLGRGGRPGAHGRMPQMPEKGRRGKRGGPWRVVFWVALVVFVLALAALGAIAFSYWQGQHSYDSLAEEAFDAPEDVAGTSLADLTVDWDALRAINPDVVGWIYVPGTKVNYPIMHSGDDETYLTRDFYGNEGGWWMADYGAVFLSGGNRPDFTDTNNIVYGHNLLNGSMFADIAGLADEQAFDGHRTIYLLTPQGNYRLTSFALVNVFADDPLVQTSFASAEDFAAYVQDKIDRSIVTPDEGFPAAADVSQTFAFSTCDHDHSEDKRYVLFCSVDEYASTGSADAGAVNPEDAGAIDDAAGEVA